MDLSLSCILFLCTIFCLLVTVYDSYVKGIPWWTFQPLEAICKQIGFKNWHLFFASFWAQWIFSWIFVLGRKYFASKLSEKNQGKNPPCSKVNRIIRCRVFCINILQGNIYQRTLWSWLYKLKRFLINLIVMKKMIKSSSKSSRRLFDAKCSFQCTASCSTFLPFLHVI